MGSPVPVPVLVLVLVLETKVEPDHERPAWTSREGIFEAGEIEYEYEYEDLYDGDLGRWSADTGTRRSEAIDYDYD